MTSCTELSDRMPAVAAGQSAWTAAEGSHLGACADCGAEWEIVRATARLGADVGLALDPAGVATGVLERLRRVPAEPRRRRWVHRVAVPIAAAATLALAVWFGELRAPESGAAENLVAVLHELDDLTADELEYLFAEVDAARGDLSPPVDAPGTLGDLSDAELEALLRMMEG
jgi:hypothetical protein